MNKELIASALKKLKENSPKKNFKQSVDLIINLKGLDLKNPEHNINMFVALHHGTGKKVSVCALVDADMESRAKEACDEVILLDQFARFKGKADIKKLASRHDFFIAQASIMPKIATVFGRYFGPRGKMPNPKLGSVVPPNANLNLLYEKLANTIGIATKNEPTIKCRVGLEDTPDDILSDNILAVYNSILQKLPNEKENVKSVMLKLTMGPSFVVGEEADAEDVRKSGKKAAEKTKKKPAEEKTQEKASEKPKEELKQERQNESVPEPNKKASKPGKSASKENKK